MSLQQFLSKRATILLDARNRKEAVTQLLEALRAEAPRLDVETVCAAVLEREKSISTRISAGIALPHARIDELGGTLLAAGLSRAGMTWGSTEEAPVHLVLLLLGDTAQPREHLHVLSQAAGTLRQEGLLDKLQREARSADQFYAVLAGDAVGQAGREDARISASVYAHACGVCREIGADALLLLADASIDLAFLAQHPHDGRLLLAGNRVNRPELNDAPLDAAMEVPLAGIAAPHRVELALFTAILQGHIDKEDTIVCASAGPDGRRLEGISVIDVARDFELLLSLQDELRSGDIDQQVFNGTLNLAAELAREGREGKPVGTIFVLGDGDGVLARSQQMVINPFKGYPEEERNLLDPSLHDTLKEFSAIDGAFIIAGDGLILAAGTYLGTEGAKVDVPMGLGARHTTAAGITAITRAISVVVSESTGTVRIFKAGKQLLALKRGAR